MERREEKREGMGWRRITRKGAERERTEGRGMEGRRREVEEKGRKWDNRG